MARRYCINGCGRVTWDAKASLCWTCENSGEYCMMFTGDEE